MMEKLCSCTIPWTEKRRKGKGERRKQGYRKGGKALRDFGNLTVFSKGFSFESNDWGKTGD